MNSFCDLLIPCSWILPKFTGCLVIKDYLCWKIPPKPHDSWLYARRPWLADQREYWIPIGRHYWKKSERIAIYIFWKRYLKLYIKPGLVFCWTWMKNNMFFMSLLNIIITPIKFIKFINLFELFEITRISWRDVPFFLALAECY